MINSNADVIDRSCVASSSTMIGRDRYSEVRASDISWRPN